MADLKIDQRDPNLETSAAMDQWISRYGLSNPLEAWKKAPAGMEGDVAFRAVGSEPRFLLTVTAKIARAIADAAEKMATYILQAGTNVSAALTTAATVVLQRIRAFRAAASDRQSEWLVGEEKSVASQAIPTGGFIIPEPYREIWGQAFANYPAFTEGTGSASAALVTAIGPERLVRLESPMGDLFTIVAARFVSRCARGMYPGNKMEARQWAAVIDAVGRYATIAGKPLLAVGYEGLTGTYPDRARLLAYDAIGCVDLASRGSDLGVDPKLGLWEMAAETHCYVSVALNPSIFAHMDYDRCKTLAAMAARFAQSAIDAPAAFVVPQLPAFLNPLGPQSVFSAGVRFLPDGVPRRKSDPLPGMLPRQLTGNPVHTIRSDGRVWRPIQSDSALKR